MHEAVKLKRASRKLTYASLRVSSKRKKRYNHTIWKKDQAMTAEVHIQYHLLAEYACFNIKNK